MPLVGNPALLDELCQEQRYYGRTAEKQKYPLGRRFLVGGDLPSVEIKSIIQEAFAEIDHFSQKLLARREWGA